MYSYRQLFLQHVAQTSDAPLQLEIESAEGVYLKGPDGQRYIDLISGISVSSLGHSNPKVMEAIQNQSKDYLHLMVYGEFVQKPQVLLAEQITHHLPESLQSVYFVNSGSEAVEGAMKLAKRYTGRKQFVAARNAYHGNTHAPLSLMSDAGYTQAFAPLLPGISFINYNKTSDLETITRDTAAVFIETVQGEAGYLPAELNYLKALRARCTEVGALLILDEIQCGMGRTGKMFAFEHYGIIPDVLLLAKAFGGGLPLGAFISSKEIMHVLTHNPVLGHITTFGGHPLSCAAALAGLHYLLDEELMKKVPAKEALFRQLLRHPKIKSITGKGLMLALEFESFEVNKAIIDRCIEQGLLTDWFLFAPEKLRLSPPLIISSQEIEKACEILIAALD